MAFNSVFVVVAVILFFGASHNDAVLFFKCFESFAKKPFHWINPKI